jgi:putative ATP-binding cassette transporter
VRLNFDQFDKEANFRTSLIHLRENAEAVSLTRREGRLIRMLLRNLTDLAGNFRHIISVNRNVNFFTNGYNWLIQIIPALIVAPLFIDGRVQFGVITQSAIAFTQLLGAFSLIVSQFQNISSFTAVLARLSSLVDATERGRAAEMEARDFSKDENRVAYNGLTLLEPRSGKILLRELTLDIPHGTHMLVLGQDETARMALFRATAGLWDVSAGRIIRPRLEQLLFVTERPYLPPGTFRELFMRPWAEEVHPSERNPEDNEFPEGKIMEALRLLGLEELPERFGGMDIPHTWESLLSLGEQQQLAIARVLVAAPRFVFLDKPSTTLSSRQIDWILGLFEKNAISYVTFEEKKGELNRYESVLELGVCGMWDCKPIKDGVIVEKLDKQAG